MATTSRKSSSSSSLQDRMEKDLLTCPICCGRYNNPRVLKCQHTFCYQCLHGCMKIAEKSSKKTIKCPVCRKVAYIPPRGTEDFPTSFVITGLLNMVKDCEKKSAKDQGKVTKSSLNSNHDKQLTTGKNRKMNAKTEKARSVAAGKQANTFKSSHCPKNSKTCKQKTSNYSTNKAPLVKMDSNRIKLRNSSNKTNKILLQKNRDKTAINEKDAKTKTEVKSNLVREMVDKFDKPGRVNKTSGASISNVRKPPKLVSVKAHEDSTQRKGSKLQSKPTTSNGNQELNKTKKIDITVDKTTSTKCRPVQPKADENANVKTLKNFKDYDNESDKSELDSVYEDEYTLSSLSDSYDGDSETSYTDSCDSDSYDSTSDSYDDEESSDDSYSDSSSFTTSTDDESSDQGSPTTPKLQSCSGIKLNMKVCIFNKKGRRFNGVVRVLEKFVRRPPKQTCVYAGVQLERENACLSTKDLKDMDDSFLNSWFLDASFPCAVVRVDQCISSKLLKEYL